MSMIRQTAGPASFRAQPSLISNWSPAGFCWRNSCSRFTRFFSRRRRIACFLSRRAPMGARMYIVRRPARPASLVPRHAPPPMAWPGSPSPFDWGAHAAADQIIRRCLRRPHLGQHRWVGMPRSITQVRHTGLRSVAGSRAASSCPKCCRASPRRPVASHPASRSSGNMRRAGYRAQIKHMPLHRPAARYPTVLHDAPIAVVFAVLVRACGAET
jgi:hypothetical protein